MAIAASACAMSTAVNVRFGRLQQASKMSWATMNMMGFRLVCMR